MSDAAAAVPVQGKDRLHHLDMIRGVALFGILLMNVTSFGLPMAYADPTVSGGATGPNLWAWITTTMLFEGTQRALFSILFGAGVILLTSRLEAGGRTDVADIYHRRSLWLIVFGVIHSYLLLWTGEILFAYGLAGLFYLEAHRGSYVDVLLFQAPISAYMQSWFIYRYFLDVFSLMLVGMALFKLSVLTLRRPNRVYAAMVGIGYGVGLTANYYELRIVLDGQFSVLAFLRAG